MTTLVVDWCGRPPTTNAHRRLHHHARAQLDAVWRKAGVDAVMVHKAHPMNAVEVETWGVYPTKTVPDLDGTAPALKAVLDGIVEAGVLVDDAFPYVRRISYLPHVVTKGASPALCVRLVEVDG